NRLGGQEKPGLEGFCVTLEFEKRPIRKFALKSEGVIFTRVTHVHIAQEESCRHTLLVELKACRRCINDAANFAILILDLTSRFMFERERAFPEIHRSKYVTSDQLRIIESEILVVEFYPSVVLRTRHNVPLPLLVEFDPTIVERNYTNRDWAVFPH